MKIRLLEENYRKPAFDILNIFFPKEDLYFVESGEDLLIGEDFLKLGGRVEGFSDTLSLKQGLYKELSDFTGYKSPRGLMTGSKPGKALEKYGGGFLKREYFLSEEKLDLLENISGLQGKLDFDQDAFNLYINIPFCPTRCDYCSYPTILGRGQDKSLYVDYLIREIEGLDLAKDLDTIYFGGGTPSFLDIKDMERLLAIVNKKFSAREVTYEAGREDSLDFDKLVLLKDYGVDRVSLNPQTFSEEVLSFSRRNFDLDNFLKIYQKAQDLGFIINMDFIVGLFGEDRASFSKNFSYLKRLRPENITFHALAGKVGSKYFEKNIGGLRDRALLISQDIGVFTRENSYFPYYLYRQKNIISNLENVGYEREGTPQRYNIIINEEKENILGLGMNANSKLTNGKKYRNPRNLRDYYENFERVISDKNDLLKEYKRGRA